MNNELIYDKQMINFILYILFSVNLMKQQVEKEGISLTKQYNMIAKEEGITVIDKIKFLNLQNINLLKENNSYFENSRGLALSYSVFYKNSAPVEVLLYELRHVAQFELFEDLNQFVTIYSKEIFNSGMGMDL